jgi:hypothetical protein
VYQVICSFNSVGNFSPATGAMNPVGKACDNCGANVQT